RPRTFVPWVLCAAATLAACGDDTASAPAASRVVAVRAGESTRTPEAFCDVLPEPSSAPTFALPDLADAIEVPRGRWAWINVWATWCAPCVEEIPTLVEWQRRLTSEGAPVGLVL